MKSLKLQRKLPFFKGAKKCLKQSVTLRNNQIKYIQYYIYIIIYIITKEIIDTKKHCDR